MQGCFKTSIKLPNGETPSTMLYQIEFFSLYLKKKKHFNDILNKFTPVNYSFFRSSLIGIPRRRSKRFSNQIPCRHLCFLSYINQISIWWSTLSIFCSKSFHCRLRTRLGSRLSPSTYYKVLKFRIFAFQRSQLSLYRRHGFF